VRPCQQLRNLRRRRETDRKGAFEDLAGAAVDGQDVACSKDPPADDDPPVTADKRGGWRDQNRSCQSGGITIPSNGPEEPTVSIAHDSKQIVSIGRAPSLPKSRGVRGLRALHPASG
jgi:hypothetical protein